MNLLSEQSTRTRIHFPETRDVIISLIERHLIPELMPGQSASKMIDHCFRKVGLVHNAITDYHESRIGAILSDVRMKLESSEDSIEYISRQLTERWKAPNEFFTIFDMAAGREVLIDPRMQELIGLDPARFFSSTIEALDPEKTIYYTEDLLHAMRFAMICYLVMTMSGFTWRSQRDHYMVRLRLSTRNSQSEIIRRLPYITVEKRCYFGFDTSHGAITVPQYHFDRYTVYPDLEIDHVVRTIVSEEKQSIYMNACSYLFNLQLTGISPKYVLMLDERRTHDRNKAVAKSMSTRISAHARPETRLDEHHIADCFAKTVRHTVQQAFNTLDRRVGASEINIDSDSAAVFYAQKLGLLPLPSLVRDLMYSMVG